MKKLSSLSLILSCALVLLSLCASASTHHQMIYKTANDFSSTATAISLTDPFWNDDHSNANVKSVRNYSLRLYYNRIGDEGPNDNWVYEVEVTKPDATKCTLRLDKQGAASSSSEVLESMYYDAFSGNGVLNFSVKEVSSNIDHYSGLAQNIRLEITLITERHEVLDTDYDLRPAYDAATQTVSWRYCPGAEEYDLEWVYIDANAQILDNNGVAQSIFGSLSANEDPFTFKEPTRIRTTKQHFKMDMTYPTGKLYFRVRPVGRYHYYDNLLGTYRFDYVHMGTWDYDHPSKGIAFITIQTDFEEDKNWMYNITFAEDGKHKGVINYADQSLRSRQTQTYLSSTGTIVAGNTFYDYEGRPTVQVIPSPVSGSDLSYKDNMVLDRSNQTAFRKNVFDNPDVAFADKALGTNAGSGQYYSPNNNTPGINSEYIPDAKGYPYTQVEFMRDNTGRVKRSSGIGIDHALGSGHETKYYYAKAHQYELSRLFGSNVGKAQHYQKNVVKDANGQYYGEYLDGEGRTIATFLIGENPKENNGDDKLLPLASLSDQVLYMDLFQGDHPQTQTTNNPYSFITDFALFNSVPEVPFYFQYTITSDMVNDLPPLPLGECESCAYDISFEILDEFGVAQTLSYDGANVNRIDISYTPQVDANCNAAAFPPVIFTCNTMTEMATYTLRRSIGLNQSALDNLKNSASLLSTYPSTDAYLEYYTQMIDKRECDVTCEDECIRKLTTDPLQPPSPEAIAQCVAEECVGPLVSEELDEAAQHKCAEVLNAMRMHVSPGGWLYDSDTGSDYWTNVLNRFDAGELAFPSGTAPANREDLYDIDEWNAAWVDELVKLHPEFCHYEKCILSEAFDRYRYEMAIQANWDEADQGGFTTPLTPISSNPNRYHDPLYDYIKQQGSNPYLSTFESKINNYMNNLPLSDYVKYQNTPALYNGIDTQDPDAIKEQRWRLFEGMYEYEREMLLNSHFSNCEYIESENRLFSDPTNLTQQSVTEEMGELNSMTCQHNAEDWVSMLETSCSLSLSPANKDLITQHFYNYCSRSMGPANPLGVILESDISTNDPDLIAIINILGSGGTTCLTNIAASDPFYTYETSGGSSCTQFDIPISQQACVADLIYVVSQTLNNGPVVIDDRFSIDDLPSVYNLKTCFQDNSEFFIEYKYQNDFLHQIIISSENGSGCVFYLYDANGNPVKVHEFLDFYDIRNVPNPPSFIPHGHDVLSFTAVHEVLDLPTLYISYDPSATCFAQTKKSCVVTSLITPLAGDYTWDEWKIDCLNDLTLWAQMMSENADKAKQKEFINHLLSAHKQSCIDELKEELICYYSIREHHYTLFYYDQAGNLVQTVPPEGVRPLSSSSFNVKGELLAGHEPQHEMATTYTYNGANQVVQSTSPDAGTNTFTYDNMLRLKTSTDANQTTTTLTYDDLGRITQSKSVNGTTTQLVVTTVWDKVDLTNFPDLENDPGAGKTPDFIQENLRNRIAAVFIEQFDELGHNPQNNSAYKLDYATHYSYDIHGNVKDIWQENRFLKDMMPGFTDHRYKHTSYDYDIYSGNVNQVAYQEGLDDQYYHRYEYDEDNRLTAAYTSENGKFWQRDAKYFYYLHGPLARVELGHHKVQATDYAYTLHGWLKGVNSDNLDTRYDIGKDAMRKTNNPNALVAKDAFGFSLGYYDGDYSPTGQMSRNFHSKVGAAAYKNLYNGNIGYMVSNIHPEDNNNLAQKPTAHLNIYQYDQLQRFRKMRVGIDTESAQLQLNNSWDAITIGDAYAVDVTYDANGNIETLKRNAHEDNSVVAMDDMTYAYIYDNGEKTNKLKSVTDNANDRNLNDIKKSNNSKVISTGTQYAYDNNGNLTRDARESLLINWTPDNKVRSVSKYDPSDINTITEKIHFLYDALGNRTAKIVETPVSGASNKFAYTYYARDAQGNPLAIYESSYDGSAYNGMFQNEVNLYGSSRLGSDKQRMATNIKSLQGPTLPLAYSKELGNRHYELSNHLGNVLSVVSDRKLASGNFSTNMDFNQGTSLNGWNSLNYSDVTNENGRLKVECPSDKTFPGARYLMTNLIIGKEYTFTIDLDMGSASKVEFSLRDGTNGDLIKNYSIFTTNSTITRVFTASQTEHFIFVIDHEHPVSTTFYLDNFSLSKTEDLQSVVQQDFNDGIDGWKVFNSPRVNSINLESDHISLKTNQADGGVIRMFDLPKGKSYMLTAKTTTAESGLTITLAHEEMLNGSASRKSCYRIHPAHNPTGSKFYFHSVQGTQSLRLVRRYKPGETWTTPKDYDLQIEEFEVEELEDLPSSQRIIPVTASGWQSVNGNSVSISNPSTDVLEYTLTNYFDGVYTTIDVTPGKIYTILYEVELPANSGLSFQHRVYKPNTNPSLSDGNGRYDGTYFSSFEVPAGTNQVQLKFYKRVNDANPLTYKVSNIRIVEQVKTGRIVYSQNFESNENHFVNHDGGQTTIEASYWGVHSQPYYRVSCPTQNSGGSFAMETEQGKEYMLSFDVTMGTVQTIKNQIFSAEANGIPTTTQLASINNITSSGRYHISFTATSDISALVLSKFENDQSTKDFIVDNIDLREAGSEIAYIADIVSTSDYYPFGMIMPERKYSPNGYRYGFQGQEKDKEVGKGEGNSVNYKFRMHDPRLGRFFAVDPLAPKYPHNSVYAFSENRLIDGVELEGLEWAPYDADGNRLDISQEGWKDKAAEYKWEGYDNTLLGYESKSTKRGYLPNCDNLPTDAVPVYSKVAKPGTVEYGVLDNYNGSATIYYTNNYLGETKNISYSARLREYMPILLKHEGGYVNHPNDPGGHTNKGVTLNTYKRYSEELFGITGSLSDLKNLSDLEAMLIYEVGYWQKSQAGSISDDKLSYLYFDTYMNGGGRAVLSNTINVYLDKGNRTSSMINDINTVLKSNDPKEVFDTYKTMRLRRYDNLIKNRPTLKSFEKGWYRRVNSFQY